MIPVSASKLPPPQDPLPSAHHQFRCWRHRFFRRRCSSAVCNSRGEARLRNFTRVSPPPIPRLAFERQRVYKSRVMVAPCLERPAYFLAATVRVQLRVSLAFECRCTSSWCGSARSSSASCHQMPANAPAAKEFAIPGKVRSARDFSASVRYVSFRW